MELVTGLWFALAAFADRVCQGHKHLVFVIEDKILICEDLTDRAGAILGWALSRERPCFVLSAEQIGEVAARVKEEERQMREEEGGLRYTKARRGI